MDKYCINGAAGKTVNINGKDCINMATLNFLGFIGNKEIEKPKKAKVTRKFLLVEGIYAKYGDTCPLPELVELKWKYKLRIILEESLSFGVLGASGRGITEHFDIPVDNIELIAASLENSMASMGGFCCGKKFVIDHQRLAGWGYCFSNSQPPMVAVAATEALNLMQKNPGLLVKLRDNCQRVHKLAQGIYGVKVCGIPLSPVQHLQLAEPTGDRGLDNSTLHMVQDMAISQGVAITPARYLEEEEHQLPQPSIRLAVSAHPSEEEIDRSMAIIKNAFFTVLHSNTAINSIPAK
nr:hypothetical protein BaRGS_020428 [Batillaria attramentaria]